jgi:hypothetical protein
MSLSHALRVMASGLVFVLVLPSGSGRNGLASGQTYTPRNQDEVELLSVIIATEMKANSWLKSELICVSINGQDPTSELVKSLRQRNLNVCKASEFKKRFNCDFDLQLEYTLVEPLQNAKVRSKIGDLREIKNGEAHFSTLLKDGQYSLQKIDGKWSISGYVSKAL